MAISGREDALDFGFYGRGIQLLLEEVVVGQDEDQHFRLFFREDCVLLLRHQEEQ